MIRRVLAALLSLVMLCVQPALADDALKAELQKRYDALSASLTARDWQAMLDIEAPGYLSIDVDGKVSTGAEEVADARNLPPMADKASRTTVLSAVLSDGVANVEQQVDIRFTQTDAQGAKHVVEAHALSSDVWKQVDGVWRIFKTTTNQLDMSVDGKAVVHKARTAA